MKYKLLLVVFFVLTTFSFAQQKGSFWKSSSRKGLTKIDSRMNLPEKNLLDLDVSAVREMLVSSPQRNAASKKSNVILSLPNAEGQMEQFTVFENSNMDPELAAKYSEIKSYVGYGVDNPTLKAYFSISPLGFKAMVLGADRSAVFIEPYSQDLTTYSVYRKSDKSASLGKFECTVIDAVTPKIDPSVMRPNADDATLRTFRLAMSVTGEYTTYFGGTKALALAAINNTLTRVNGVFETDFGVHMNLIANTDLVIYTNASTDPYDNANVGAGGTWNQQLQTTLTNVIGSANYDIGHLFGATGGGGNAGCIACVCKNPTQSAKLGKGSGFTSPADGIPSGDDFDIDYVAHEMGHQFGGNHTFTFSNEGTIAQVEPGSGSTIMGYAGITSVDIQPHSDAYFHAISIQQITNYIKTTTCQTNTSTGNAIPTANAGLDYTIPKSTPFMLTGAGTDANGDVLTYNWEQMDSQSNSAAPSATKTTGVDFRSYNSSTSPTRYFPKISSVLAGATTTAGAEITVEALPSVARTLNFRLTVRDNHVGGPGNNSDDMIVTVNATAGPLSVTSPNTAVSYVGGSSQTITWNVAGTTANGVNCANVDILLSTNGGSTWSALLEATPNDGTQAVTIPNTPGTANRIMVKGSNHIFFDVSNANFTITAGSTDTVAPTAPTLAASGTTQTTTSLSWSGATDNVAVTGYDVYKDGALVASTTGTTYNVSGLTPTTTYLFTVKAKDAAGNVSAASNGVSVTTLSPAPDTTPPSAPTLSASGTTQTTTNLSWSGATDNVGVTGYDVYKNGALLASTSATTYNVSGLTASTTYTFTVKAKDAAGNSSTDSNTVSVTTLPLVVGGSDLYFSEYLEGSSNNKALEIANSTGASVSLSGYVIKKQANGAGAWSTGLTLSGTLNDGAKYVVVNSSIKSNCYSAGSANISTAATELTFNGNDPVGLFKNGVLIDIIGTFNGGSANFAVDVTLRRKATIKSPNTTFNKTAEWDTYSRDTCGGIGNRIDIADSTNNDLNAIELYPNPVNGGILNISNLELDSEYRIFNMIGQELGKGKIENESVYVGSLSSGTYLIQIYNENGSVARRFIKQ